MAEYLNRTGQKGVLDDEGNLVYERDGNVVRITNKKAAQQYIQLQEAYGKALSDNEELIRRAIYNKLKDFLPSENFTLNQLELLKKDKNILKEGSSEAAALENGIEFLKSLAYIKKVDYVPRVRFGSYAIMVRDKATKEQVALFTVEKGSFKDAYDTYQVKETIKAIKEKYDSTEYEVVTDKGPVSAQSLDEDSFIPFKLTYNELSGNIDPRFLNIETLSGLLATTNVDPEQYGYLRDQLYVDILTRGFNKHFTESQKLDGFSKDWPRAMQAYFAGSAHYLSGIQQKEELAAIQKEAIKLKDDTLKNYINSYIDYVGSPNEDMQLLRSFNFLWALGGNVSTALLQVMTLPTSTLAVMTSYNPNFVENMALIGKWFTVGLKEFSSTSLANFSSEDGSVEVQFDNKDVWDKLIKNGTADERFKVFAQKETSAGRLRGVQAHEYAGTQPFETRTLSCGLRKNAKTVANYFALPISAMEQMTRFATSMAAFELMAKNKQARDRAFKILENDFRFQAQLSDRTFDPIEHLASFSVDEAHAVFGKQGRPEMYRGILGAFVFPFMTYPHYMLELLPRMFGRGTDGKRAAALFLMSLVFFAGLIGLPGSELAKELYELMYQQVTGIEMDLDLAIREKVYGLTGSPTAAKMLTHGFGRAFLGVDVSRRISLGLPGQEQLLALTGVRGDASAFMGVQGSVLSGIADSWTAYNAAGGFTPNVAASLMPISVGNVLKASSMGSDGVSTAKGVQLVTPEDVTTQSKIARLVGFTSDQIASEREELFFTQIKERKYRMAVDRFRERAARAKTNAHRAEQRGDIDKAEEFRAEYKNVIMELREFFEKNNIRQRDFAAFNRSVNKKVRQDITGERSLKDIRKEARPAIDDLKAVLGTDN